MAVLGFRQDIEAYKTELETQLAASSRGFGFLPPATEAPVLFADGRIAMFAATVPNDFPVKSMPGFSVPVNDDIIAALEGAIVSPRTFALLSAIALPTRPTRERPIDITTAKTALAAFGRDALADIRAQMSAAREVDIQAAEPAPIMEITKDA